MTTVATDGHSMAADSRATDATSMCSVTKLRRIDGWLVGFAGGVADGAALLRRLGRAGVDPVSALKDWCADGALDDAQAALLLCSPRGRIYLYEGGASEPWRVQDRVAAIGSGGPVALGAMLAGVEPGEAVRIAAKVDPSTGGRVRVIRRKNSRPHH